MFIIDDRSIDNTGEILRRFGLETQAVTILDDGWNGAFHQGKRTTLALDLVRRIEDWDCILVLDADEFVCADSRSTLEREIREIPPGSVGGLPVYHYWFHPTDDASIRDAVARMKFVWPPSAKVFKCFPTKEFLKKENLAFSDGNHAMTVDGASVDSWSLPTVMLAHFAVRSLDQLVLKVMKNYVGWRSRADFNEGLSFHITFAARALKNEPAFALENNSRVLSALFSGGKDEIAASPFEFSRLVQRPFDERKGTLKWPELAVSLPYAQVFGLFDEMISRLSVIDHLSMFSGENDPVSALKRLVDAKEDVSGEEDRLRAELGLITTERDGLRTEIGLVTTERDSLHDSLHELQHSRSAAGKNYVAALSASLKRSWRKRFPA